MTMDYDDEEQRMQSNPERFLRISIERYGQGFIYPDSRDMRELMAAATRIDDRSQEIPLNRGGDWVHRLLTYSIPKAILFDDEGNLIIKGE